MKKPYQIEAQRAVRQLEAMANDGNPAVQMMLPMAEMVGWIQRRGSFRLRSTASTPTVPAAANSPAKSPCRTPRTRPSRSAR